MAGTETSTLFAIILAGGASSRLHASSPQPTVDKPLLMLEGKPVLTHVIDAVQRYVDPERIVVVGPDTLPTGTIATVYETPPRSGPYMGVHTGVQYFAKQYGAAHEDDGLLLIGADMPRVGLGIDRLLDQHDAAAGVAIAQADGGLQPMLSYVPRTVAERLFAQPVINAGLMRVLRSGDYRVVDVPAAAVADLDTYDDAVAAGITF